MKFEFKKWSLILLSWIPGSGKSTFVKKFFPRHYIISSDELRDRYFGDEYKFLDEGLIVKWNFESNSDFIFDILKQIVVARAKEGLTTVIDAMNLNDGVRQSFISLYDWERIYTIVFDDKKAFEFNELRKWKKWYVSNSLLEKKQLSFSKKTRIKKNKIVFADEITEVEEKFEKLDLTENNNILVWWDIHGIKEFYKTYKKLNEKYTKNWNKPLNVFVGDIVDRWEYSVDNLCFIISEIKKWNTRMIAWNHEMSFLRNIEKYLDKWIIDDQVFSRYQTIKSFVKLHQNEGVYDGFVEEIKWQNFNLFRIRNFIKLLPFYKIIETWTDKKYLITHAPVLIPDNLWDLKKSLAIYGPEQLKYNIKLPKQEQEKNNENFVKAAWKLYKTNKVISVFGHVDFSELIEKNNIKWLISLEWKVDSDGYLKVLVLSKENGKITEKIEKIKTTLNFDKTVAESMEWENLYTKFNNCPLIKGNTVNDFTVFKYKKKVFYNALWWKNDYETNKMLLQARWLVLDRMWNIISYPFDKVFNYGEKILNQNNDIITEHKNFKWKYQFIEKINGFLWIISQHPYNKNDLLMHTWGSLEWPYINYINEYLSAKQKLNLIKFIKQNGKHTFMFEVVHPADRHIVEYDESKQWLHLIGLRKLEWYNLEDMKLYSEEELDEIADKLGFSRPYHFIADFDETLKRIKNEKIEWYMMRDLETWKHLLKIKTPYYLTTKFLWRMNDKLYKFLFSNKEAFIEKNEIDEEFFPVVDFIYENKEKFEKMDNEQRVMEIKKFLDGE